MKKLNCLRRNIMMRSKKWYNFNKKLQLQTDLLKKISEKRTNSKDKYNKIQKISEESNPNPKKPKNNCRLYQQLRLPGKFKEENTQIKLVIFKTKCPEKIINIPN